MPRSITIEPGDRSVRWYLTPGEQTTYEIAVSNTGDEAIQCVLKLDEPPNSGVIQPSAFTLEPGEARNAQLTFRPDAKASRDQLAIVTARDADNRKVGEFQITLISVGGTDCATTLAWKGAPDAEDAPTPSDGVQGFVLALSLKSLSQSDGEFQVDFSAHPALEFPALQPLHLAPGQVANVDIPVRWHPDVKGADGFNHPRVIEVGVAVSQGRRSSRLAWDLIARKLSGTPEEETPAIVEHGGDNASAETSPAATETPRVSALATAVVASPPVEALRPALEPVASAPQSGQFDGLEESVVGLPRRGFRPYDLPIEEAPKTAAPKTPAPKPPVPKAPARKMSEGPPAQTPPRESGPRIPTLISIGFAAIILAVAVIFYFPRPNQSSVATTAAVVTTQPTIAEMNPATSAPKKAPTRKPVRTTSRPAATPAATRPPATPASTTANAVATAVAALIATPRPKKSVVATAPPTPTPLRRRLRPIDRSTVVAVEGISARYGPTGRAVRVVWSASSQASANIQVLNDRGAVISTAGVSGPRQNALLYLPRSYHGPIYVQVVSVGYQGERVTQSTSLPPF
jgi:hypothetical protein